ncbi:MAG: serine hydrolase [Propionibacteriales bacterium]|nr:serine hydrolase [Propionibacteriales bacterium]
MDLLAPELDAVGGEVSVWCGRADGTPVWTRLPDQQHYAASTMKLPVLVAAHRRAAAGGLDLDAAVPVHNEFASVHDGSAYSLDHAEDSDDQVWDAIGTSRPLRWLTQRMIVRSSNLATNLVLDQVGVPAVAEALDACGSTATTVARGIEDYQARDHGLDNMVTAPGLAAVLVTLVAERAADPAACKEILDVCAANEWNDGIPAGLPAGTRVSHKNGWQNRVCHDAALVQPADAEPFVLVVLTTTDLERSAADALTARIAAAAYTDLTGSRP